MDTIDYVDVAILC